MLIKTGKKNYCLKKTFPAQYQKLIFTTELNRIKDSKNYIVIAGVIGNSQITKDFIVEISKNNIKYVEFDSIFLEAEYVAAKCHETVLGNPDTKIAVLISDEKIKDCFIAKFNKYKLKFANLLGENI